MTINTELADLVSVEASRRHTANFGVAPTVETPAFLQLIRTQFKPMTIAYLMALRDMQAFTPEFDARLQGAVVDTSDMPEI
jgi:hypothetical protein